MTRSILYVRCREKVSGALVIYVEAQDFGTVWKNRANSETALVTILLMGGRIHTRSKKTWM